MSIFWNRSERRLRALWRLLVQFISMFVLSGIMSFMVLLILVVIPGAARFILEQKDTYSLLMDNFRKNPYIGLFIILLSCLVIFFSVWLAARFLDHRGLADLGFHFNRRWWLDLLFGLALGAGMMSAIFGVEWATGWVAVLPQSEAAGSSLILAMTLGLLKFILVGIQEETFSRGYQLVNLAEGLNLSRIGRRAAVWMAFFLSSVVFGMLHLGNPNVSIVSLLNLCFAGALLGLPYLLTGELALSIGVHITWNYFQGYIFGFPVSGLPTTTALIQIRQSGPALWTGSAFGPEGGLVSVIMMALGIGLIILWVRATRGRVKLDERIGVYSTNAPQPISNVLAPE